MEKFSGLLATGGRWGNHVRKLKIADQDWEEDGRYYEDKGWAMAIDLLLKKQSFINWVVSIYSAELGVFCV